MIESAIKPISYQSKTQLLTASILSLVNELGPGGKLPTMQQMCKAFQVSIVTLDRALRNLELQHLIYRRHSVGIFVSPRRNQQTIGLVYGYDIFQAGISPYAQMVLKQVEARATSNNERFSFYLDIALSKECFPTHQDLMDAVQSGRLSGAIFAGIQDPSSIEWIEKQGVPVVALSSTPVTRYRVACDFAELVRLGVQALVEEGCRRITLIPMLSEGQKSIHFGTVDAFREAMRDAGLPLEREAIWNQFGLSSDRSRSVIQSFEELGYEAIQGIFGEKGCSSLDMGERPDGLVIANDMMTRGAAVALQEMGLRIGADVKIATHANRGSPVLWRLAQKMIVVEVDPAEFVEAAFRMLETLMDGKKTEPEVVLIRPQLTQKAMTGGGGQKVAFQEGSEPTRAEAQQKLLN